MEILSYFRPETLVAEIIVWVLLIVFAGWVLFLGRYWYQLAGCRRQVKNCADVSLLTNAFRQRLLQQGAGQSSIVPGLMGQLDHPSADLASPASPAMLSVPSQHDADEAFKNFCQINRLKEQSPVARHIRAIFNAGWNESRLEVDGLINNTAGELLRRNSAFRSVLSVFIIIGLLGTLFGLASTLAQLARDLNQPAASALATPDGKQSSTSPEKSQPSSDDMKKKLDRMLGQMQGAFAPSIVGVTFSILGVLLFALFQSRASSRLRTELERLTLIDWVPALIPTPAQTLQEKVQLSEQQIQKSLDSAIKVAALSDEITDGASDLNQAIIASKSSLTSLTDASTNLSRFSDNFVRAVSALTPFQKELHLLYEQMRIESRAFQDSVQKNIAGAETFQKNIEIQLAEQNRQLPLILSAFQGYEKAYVTSRQDIDADLRKLLEKLDNLLISATLTFENLGERNKEITSGIVTALGDPLRGDVSKGLGEVKGALDASLTTVSRDLKSLFSPLDTTSTYLKGTIENLDKRTDKLLQEVQQEFAKQNKANDEQLQGVLMLSASLKLVLEKLAGSSQSFADYGQKFDLGVTALSQNVGTLSGKVDILSQKLGRGPNEKGALDSDFPLMIQLLRQMLGELQNLRQSPACNFVSDSNTPQIRKTLDQMLRVQQKQGEHGPSSKSKEKKYPKSDNQGREAPLPVVYGLGSNQADGSINTDQPRRGRIKRLFGWLPNPFSWRRK